MEESPTKDSLLVEWLFKQKVIIEPITLGLVLGLFTISLAGLIISAIGQFVLTTKILVIILISIVLVNSINAFPQFAQQLYSDPIDRTGKFVCSAWHLADQPIRISTTSSVFPKSYLDLTIEIPIAIGTNIQLAGNGELSSINVGGVIVLPPGFATINASDIQLFSPWSEDRDNILVYGPMPARLYSSVVMSLVAPKSGVPLKYSIAIGGNRGRGQLYPNGTATNNGSFRSSEELGLLTRVHADPVSTIIIIRGSIIKSNLISLPIGVDLLTLLNVVAKSVTPDVLLTANPNVGGFAQQDLSIVLQEPSRLRFFNQSAVIVIVTQACLVIKKKQYERSFLIN